MRCPRRSAMPLRNVTTYKHGVQQASVIAAPVTTSPFVYGPHAGLLYVWASGACPRRSAPQCHCANAAAAAAADAADAAASLMQMLPSSIETRMARRCSVNSHDARTHYGARRPIVLQWDERRRVVDLLLFHQSTRCLKITCATFFTIRECGVVKLIMCICLCLSVCIVSLLKALS